MRQRVGEVDDLGVGNFRGRMHRHTTPMVLSIGHDPNASTVIMVKFEPFLAV